MKCKIIAIANQKGGVGKTTTSENLGYALSQMGNKVLVLDFDPQSSLTVALGYVNPEMFKPSIYDLMVLSAEDKKLPEKEEFIISTNKGIDLIPSSIELSAVEVSLINVMSREFVLKSILEDLKASYDYIIIDCTPSLGLLTINALAACNSVLIPVTPQYLSAKGLEILLKNIIRVKRKINPFIEVEGILFTMYSERMNLTKEVLSMIERAYGNKIHIFYSKIPTSVKVGEASMQSKSIIEYNLKNKVSQAYLELAKEVLAG